ncbi:hypothetical protein [Clostridium lacusfryxellense]|uniref:hypothetical protein n=1 Tax=Clostridium lacusfryxellense TaxID=205328 RepID=UPI001C0DAA00|nr:hypothetical protein [Clostridium lacusfryxellense]MBU3113910.1 hypothetical protein [Clostridium lacusfryxellense]
MAKNCIFNEKRICSNCGECEVCELNSNKKCNNCGKCLELEGYDVKAIKIDEVFENEVNDVEAIELQETEDNSYEEDKIELHKESTDNLNEVDETSKIEDYESLLAQEALSKVDKDGFIPENNEVWELIEDIEGVSELLENEEENSELLQEEFPGLITLKKI